MLTVLKHGNVFVVRNPADGRETEMVNVVFIEEGRPGAISSLSGSSDFLSNLMGEDLGLDQTRTHTQPIKADKIKFFPLGKKIEGHINRKLFSQPAMRQQEGVQSRLVDGKPTYFTTSLDQNIKPDEDYRMANETLAQVDPHAFRNTRLGNAEITILEKVSAEAQAEQIQQAEPAVQQQGGPVQAQATVGVETLGQ